MKKSLLILISAFITIQSFAQLEAGFREDEVKDMAAICNSFTFIDLYNSDSEILPDSYKKRYTSGVFGMDNKYQIYQKGKVAVINFRGSTASKISWLENINSAMIPAKGTMKVEGEQFNYCFAKDTGAAVHSGYALGIAFLQKDLLYQIKILNKEGIFSFIITGHSQGGALANMLRAYLENLPKGILSDKNRYKTYSFAAPMVGNREFTNEYNSRFCENKTSFNIVNPADPIPTFPLSYTEENYLAKNLKTFIFDNESFEFKKVVADGFLMLFEENISEAVQKIGHSTSEQISKQLGPFELPGFVEDINYYKIGNRVEIPPVEYHKILKDSTILKNDSLMTVYQRRPDGHFYNEDLYKKTPWHYQHKPYNYYISILKLYFPEDYKKTEKKYLTENL